jgi:hypothetical protein
VKCAATLAVFALRHAVASIGTVVAACVVWTITYFLLLLWAIAANAGLGGPLAYPGGLVAVVAIASVGCCSLFFPATALAEWACRRRGWPITAQIPVSVAALALLSMVAGVPVRVLLERSVSATSALNISTWLFVISLIPLGFYWWIAQAGPLVRAAFELSQRRRALRS